MSPALAAEERPVIGNDRPQDQSSFKVSACARSERLLHAPPYRNLAHTVGESLRECREQAGLSLEYIAKRTRVPLSYLQALEDNNALNLLVSPVIARAYINAYLGCLSLQDWQKEDVLIQFAMLVDAVYIPWDRQSVPPLALGGRCITGSCD